MAPDLSTSGSAGTAGTEGGLPKREVGEILAVGSRGAGGGRIELLEPPRPGEPTMRWQSHATSIDAIEKELARIWAQPDFLLEHESGGTRAVAARTSVQNLVVIARNAELGARAAATIGRLTGRHPSRTLIVESADPDGPPWLDGRVEAHCVLPRPGAPEACSELIFLTAGGATGQHLNAVVTPLLVHDLPVTLWWPGEPPLGSANADEVLDASDRLVVDGASWSGDGLARLVQMAGLFDRFPRLSIRDFALVRQSRWREAIATVFDMPDLLPYLPYVRRISVAYSASHATGAPGTTNILRPLYHVAWLASRLGMTVVQPLTPVETKTKAAGDKVPMHRGLSARLRDRNRSEVGVVMRPLASSVHAGSTLRVEITAERRGSELRADITAEAENVHVNTWLDGVELMSRVFKAPRPTEADLLSEAIEVGGREPLAVDAIRMAASLAGHRTTRDDGEPD